MICCRTCFFPELFFGPLYCVFIYIIAIPFFCIQGIIQKEADGKLVWHNFPIRVEDRHIHFLHLRNIKRDNNGNFYEATHLSGDVLICIL